MFCDLFLHISTTKVHSSIIKSTNNSSPHQHTSYYGSCTIRYFFYSRLMAHSFFSLMVKGSHCMLYDMFFVCFLVAFLYGECRVRNLLKKICREKYSKPRSLHIIWGTLQAPASIYITNSNMQNGMSQNTPKEKEEKEEKMLTKRWFNLTKSFSCFEWGEG